VGGQLLHHDARQPDAAAPGPGLGWAGVELAMDLNDDLGHIDGPAQQVDTAAVAGGSGPGRSGFGSRGSTLPTQLSNYHKLRNSEHNDDRSPQEPQR
jgi:hypothetical protein